MTLATIAAIGALLFSPLRWPQATPVSLQANQTQQEKAPPSETQPGTQEKSAPASQAPSQGAQQAPPDQNAPKEQPAPAPSGPEQSATPAANPEASPAAKQESTQPATTTAKPKQTKSKTAKKHDRSKKKAATQPAEGPTKTVVRNGSTSDPKLEFAPRLPEGEASYQRQTTAQLLSGAEEKLKSLSGRQIKPNEQATVDQIRNFMDQAKAAVKAGDLQRAHTLAYKAHLLSNDLLPPE